MQALIKSCLTVQIFLERFGFQNCSIMQEKNIFLQRFPADENKYSIPLSSIANKCGMWFHSNAYIFEHELSILHEIFILKPPM